MEIWKYCEENYVDVKWKEIDWKLLNDGDVVDLGGTKLECIYMNAHGSLVFYNRERDYALCGDNTTYTLAIGNITQDLIDRFDRYLAHFTDKTMFYSGHTYYEDGVTRPPELTMDMMRELVDAMRTVLAGGSFPDETAPEHFVVPGAPTLAGYTPDPDDEESWAAMRASHPERKGETPKPGPRVVHHVGPILFTYAKG